MKFLSVENGDTEDFFQFPSLSFQSGDYWGPVSLNSFNFLYIISQNNIDLPVYETPH